MLLADFFHLVLLPYVFQFLICLPTWTLLLLLDELVEMSTEKLANKALAEWRIAGVH